MDSPQRRLRGKPVEPVAGGERGAGETAESEPDDEAEKHVGDEPDEGLVAKGASEDNAVKVPQRGQTIPVQGWIAGDTDLIISSKRIGTRESSFRFIR